MLSFTPLVLSFTPLVLRFTPLVIGFTPFVLRFTPLVVCFATLWLGFPQKARGAKRDSMTASSAADTLRRPFPVVCGPIEGRYR